TVAGRSKLRKLPAHPSAIGRPTTTGSPTAGSDAPNPVRSARTLRSNAGGRVMSIGGRAGGKSAPHLRGLSPLVVAVTVLFCFPPAATAGSDAPQLVVVVYPDESDGAPGLILVNRAIRSTFAGQSPGRVEIRNEYVNTSRLRDADFMQTQVS